MELSRRIARTRTRLGLSQATFAARIGVTRNMVSRYERGALPGPVVLDRIAKLGDVSVEWLLHGRRDGVARQNGGPGWEEAVELLRRAWREPACRETLIGVLRTLRPSARG